MSTCRIEALPNEKWSFKIYLNGRGYPLERLRQRTKFARMLSLFPIRIDRRENGLVLQGVSFSIVRRDDLGIYIDDEGRLLCGKRTDEAGRVRENWAGAYRCLSLDGRIIPPEELNGSPAVGPTGTTMIGFRKDGTPVLLCALKGDGKSTRFGEGVTETQALNKLLKEKCVTVLQFCTGWKCSGMLRRQWMVSGSGRQSDVYLLASRRPDERPAKKGARRGPTAVDLVARDMIQKMQVRETSGAVPVRSGPGFPAAGELDNIVSYLRPGQTVTVYELSGGVWGKIGTDRWVNVNMLV